MKMNRILSLAICLALVLGMTAMAAPSSSYAVDLTAKEGLVAGATVSSMAAAAGKTVTFTATATKTAGDAEASTVIIGIYDASGALVKYASISKDMAADDNVSFSATFKIAAGQTAKAYVSGTEFEATIGQ